METVNEHGQRSEEQPICDKLDYPFPYNIFGVTLSGGKTCKKGLNITRGLRKCMCRQCGSLLWGGLSPVLVQQSTVDTRLLLLYTEHMENEQFYSKRARNGADRRGLFCDASAVLERMEIEQDVAIAQFIREMRNYREQIIPSVDQFQFVLIKECILQNETYSNFTD